MIVVPDSLPGNDEVLTFVPVTDMVKLAATAVPPLLLITFLMTVNFGWMSWFVIVQVFAVLKVSVPEQPLSDSFV